MAIQRRSQIPKAPERSVLDSIVASPVGEQPPVLTPVPDPSAPPPRVDAEGAASSEQVADQRLTQVHVAQPSLQAPARRPRKPARIVYTSKMDPDLKAWAMSYKRPGGEGEDFVEVVEQALWVLRLARSGQMPDAVAALEQAALPLE